MHVNSMTHTEHEIDMQLIVDLRRDICSSSHHFRGVWNI